MPSVIFLGSKDVGFQCLKSLLEMGVRVVSVITNDRGTKIRELSKSRGIACYDSIKMIDSYDLYADFIISVQHHEILSEKHISRANKLAINLHMAPVPEYRGCNQFSFAIIDKAIEFGTTLHRLDRLIDSGPIIAERRFPIPDGIWVNELFDLTVSESVDMFTQEMPKILQEEYTLTMQDDTARSHGFHRRNEIEQLKNINMSWEKSKIERHIRATSMPGFSPPYILVDGVKVDLYRSFKEAEDHS